MYDRPYYSEHVSEGILEPLIVAYCSVRVPLRHVGWPNEEMLANLLYLLQYAPETFLGSAECIALDLGHLQSLRGRLG